MYSIGFDVGGTFIDLFAYDAETSTLHSLKVQSSATDLASAISGGLDRLLREIRISPDGVERIAHGTTVVTNQLIEGKGAAVGVVTTSGFRDVLEIGRMRRRSLYDLYLDPVPPLADRSLRLEVQERVTATGRVHLTLDPIETSRTIAALKASGAEVIAICLLNSYANSRHEEIIEDLCSKAGLQSSRSSVIAPEYGEYERWTTTCINSHVMPRTTDYLNKLSSLVADKGIGRPLQIMQSNGGVISVDNGARYPVRLIESGPAAGVAGALTLAAQDGFSNLITMDMGGTSTDIGIVVDGKPLDTVGYSIGGYPVRVVGIDIRSIGAGGGSIARLDQTRALRIGPDSAGAEPGPACYDKGGTLPTITDADLILGYLDPSRFCGGEIPLNVDSARDAISRELAEEVGVSAEEASLAIVRVAAINMAGAIRQAMTERGLDPRDFVLAAYGGAGPVHAVLVAAELEIEHILVPNGPGLLSAMGLILADYRTDAVRTLVSRTDQVNLRELAEALRDLENSCIRQLTSGDQVHQLAVTHYLEMSYEGQQYVLPIEISGPAPTRADLEIATKKLDTSFEEIHSFLPSNRTPQILRVRVIAHGIVPKNLPATPLTPTQPPSIPLSSRDIWFDINGPKRLAAPIYERTNLVPNVEVAGPCVIEEAYATTVVQPGYIAQQDVNGHLHIISSANR